MTHEIRTLVVEDNALIGETISLTLSKHGISVAGPVTTGEDAILYTDNHEVDLLLMDINLEGPMDGISAASIILRKHKLPVIYLTDFTDNATVQRAKKTFPASYLAKPFNEFELVRAIEIAFHNFYSNSTGSKPNAATSKYFFRADTRFVRIDADDIIFLEADRAYCKVVTSKETLLLSNSMNHIQEQLGEDRFVKVQRSYVVNLNSVIEVDGNMIRLQGGHQVQMSKEHRDRFFERFRIIR